MNIYLSKWQSDHNNTPRGVVFNTETKRAAEVGYYESVKADISVEVKSQSEIKSAISALSNNGFTWVAWDNFAGTNI